MKVLNSDWSVPKGIPSKLNNEKITSSASDPDLRMLQQTLASAEVSLERR